MKKLSIKEKAVKINIESNHYGTVAEIGGGQETARHLFQAGGASNSIAKTVSAYDKLFSDHFYNDDMPARHVSEDRLCKMVKYEYDELIKILDKANTKQFFAFANTVETINYTKTNQGNGWLGIMVEGSDRYNPNLILCHVKLLENDTLLQQYTLGTLGVNLIYGGLFLLNNPTEILLSLTDNLDSDRVEIDYIYTNGPDLKNIDNRLLNLMLVRHNMTPAIMFDKTGKVIQPADMLYKKNIILNRGYFRPIHNLGMKLIEDSLEVFKRDEDYTPENTIAFCEISLNYLMHGKEVDESDFLHRVDLLNMMGQSVMVSRFQRYFELVKYFGQFKIIKLRIVVGLPTFDKILANKGYDDLRGGLLQMMGILFADNVKIYLYPALNQETGEIIYPDDNHFPPDIRLLWQYLIETRKVLIIRTLTSDDVGINTKFITSLIESGDSRLRFYVPDLIFKEIKRNRLFGYEQQL
ncbi:TonB-dependent receptor [Paludibacter sp.]